MSKVERAAHEAHEPTPPKVEDEPVHVPKGQSRTRFYIILGLMVFTLVVYVVPRQLQSLFAPKEGASTAYASWQWPGHGEQQISAMELMRLMRIVGNVGMGFEEQDAARVVIVDALAKDAGIDVGDAELTRVLSQGTFLRLGTGFVQVQGFPDKQRFLDRCRAVQLRPTEYTETLRSLLRAERYETLLGMALAQPDPKEYDAQWKKSHQEYAFDFVALEVATSVPEAAALLPADAELEAWYDALPNKNRIFAAEVKPERVSAELLTWRIDGPDPDLLLQNYPRPEGTDLELLATSYYNSFANVRFVRPEPKPDEANQHDQLYLPFAEVAEAARRESKVHAALLDWNKAFEQRVKNGESFDLAAEGPNLGLYYRREEPPKSQADWSALPDVGGPQLAAKLMLAARNQQQMDVVVGKQEMTVARVMERLPGGPPPFAEVREKAIEEWKKQKAGELAKAKLDQFHTLLSAKDPSTEATPEPAADTKLVVDAETFAAKANAQGLKVQHADWFDATKLPAELPAQPTDLDRFQAEARLSGEYMQAEDGQVLAPRLDAKQERVWLVRAAGKRDPPAVAIEPVDLANLKGGAEFAAQDKFRKDVLGLKALAQRYQLVFADGRPVADETPEG